MKYTAQIEQLLRELFYDDWMDAEDWKDFITVFFDQTGTSFELFSDQIEEGVRNGLSEGHQFKLIKNFLQSLNF